MTGDTIADTGNWLLEFRLRPTDFTAVGHGLQRPECVLALRDGSVLCSNRNRAVSVIGTDGAQSEIGGGLGLANTFTLDDDGHFLVADLKRGAVVRLDRDGVPTTVHDRWRGEPLGSVNFMLAGEEPGVAWVSVSTRDPDYRTAIETSKPDGRIFRIDADGLYLAADGLYFPNAMQIDHERGYIYVVETTAGAVSRAPLGPNGMPGAFERFGPAPLYPGAYTDGLALDAEGNVWLTELSRNAIIVIDRQGQAHTVFEDREGKVLDKPTGLAFGGADQRTVYIGSLKMTTLPAFRAPVPGHSPRLWRERRSPCR